MLDERLCQVAKVVDDKLKKTDSAPPPMTIAYC